MRYGSVCSGIEAATVAWHTLGWEPVSFSEIEPFPCAVLKHYYPDVPNLGDMTKFKEWPDAAIDILVGGTPCQSFSVAGLRKGLDDPRGNLMLTFGAIAGRFKPTWIVWENVPGVLSSNGGRDFGTFLGMLAELGYGFSYRVLDAEYFGVAQRRRRVFVVGHLGDWRCAAAVLFERESLCRNPAPSREKGKGTAACVARSLTRHYDSSSEDGTGRGLELIPCSGFSESGQGFWRETKSDIGPLRSQGEHWSKCSGIVMAHGQGGAEICSDGEPSLSCNHEAPIVFENHAQDSRVKEIEVVSLHAKAGTGGGNLPIVLNNRQGPVYDEDLSQQLGMKDNGLAVAFAQNTRDEVREMPYAGALAAQPGMKQQTYVRNAMQVRRLTPRECERLQGFPDDYTLIPYRNKQAPDGPRYKALGNSMAVPVMRWIGERIQLVENMKVRVEVKQ